VHWYALGASTRFRRKFLVQSQVRLFQIQQVSEKVPEKVPGSFWCKAKPGSTGSGERWRKFRRRFRNVPEKVPGSLGAKMSKAKPGSRVPEKARRRFRRSI
jgi:hypothetical protein